MDETGSGSCLVATFGIRGVKISGPATIALVQNADRYEIPIMFTF